MFINKKIFTIFIVIVLSFSACKKATDMNDLTSINQIPVGFPQMNIPLDNQFTLERWKLGKKLFYETKLSLDSSISCASCHKIEFAFSDNVSLSPGVFDAPGTRNAPTLTNIGFQPYFTKEGGIETLEKQVLIPIQEHNEMNFNILDAGKRLNEIDAFKKLSLETYNREMDYYVITRALACFERTIVSSNSKYDAFLKNNAILTSEELNGKNLFFGNKTNCSSCHSGILLTDFSLQNNGLYENYIDKGRYRLTLDTIDIGIFKVPTLRNVQFSSPYMHDGSMSTLKEVVEHYNEGGKNHINKSNLIKPLNLSEEEILDIVSFLETLSDFDFISNKNLKNE